MKRILCLLLAFMLAMTLFGCKRQSNQELAATDTVVPNQTEEPTEEDLPVEVPSKAPVEESISVPTETEDEKPIEETESTEEKKLDSFTEEDWARIDAQLNKELDDPNFHFSEVNITFNYSDCADLREVPFEYYTKFDLQIRRNPSPTYGEVMEYIGEDGLIVVGSAFGEREGTLVDTFMASTKTQFRIEKVFYGTAPGETITVSEDYFPDFTDDNREGEPCICVDGSYTRMRDNEKVLLFLKKSTKTEGLYFPVFYMLPVSDGYDQYTEAAEAQLLAYYRGDEAAYKTGYAQQNRWPASELTDEQLLEQLTDNVLVQTFVQHKVVLWPEGHTEYVGCTFHRDVRVGLQECSRPAE